MKLDRNSLINTIWDLYEKYNYRHDQEWEDGTYQIPIDIVKGDYEFAEDAVRDASLEELQKILSQYKTLDQKLYGPYSKRADLADQIKNIYFTQYSEDDLDLDTFWDIMDNNGMEQFFLAHRELSGEDANRIIDTFLDVASIDEMSQILEELKASPEPKHLPVTKESIISRYYDSSSFPSEEEKHVISNLARSTGGRTWAYDIDYAPDMAYMLIDLYTDTTDRGLYDAQNKINDACQKYIKEYQNKLNISGINEIGTFEKHWDDGYPCLQGNIITLVALIRAYESEAYI